MLKEDLDRPIAAAQKKACVNLDQNLCQIIIAGHVFLRQALNVKPIFGIILYLKQLNFAHIE